MFWTRKELKEKGKFAFKANYWKTVLISLLLVGLVGGSVAGSSALSAATSMNRSRVSTQNHAYEDGRDFINGIGDGWIDDYAPYYFGDIDDFEEFGGNIYDIGDSSFPDDVAVIAMVVIIFLFIALIVVAIALLLDAFLLNPLEIGARRFTLQNLNRPANVSEVGFGFDNCYKSNVKTMFFRDLYTLLWTLLFIIPGIIKSYEYRMIPYILADNPAISTEQAFEMSRQMMYGNKWKTFVLDLSFIGWELLSLLTVGLVGVFYVNPYRDMTNAALYERLRYGVPAQQNPVNPAPQPYMPQQ